MLSALCHDTIAASLLTLAILSTSELNLLVKSMWCVEYIACPHAVHRNCSLCCVLVSAAQCQNMYDMIWPVMLS